MFISMKGEKKPKKVENLTFDFLAMSCLDPLCGWKGVSN